VVGALEAGVLVVEDPLDLMGPRIEIADEARDAAGDRVAAVAVLAAQLVADLLERTAVGRIAVQRGRGHRR
jgi:hypothetical protein